MIKQLTLPNMLTLFGIFLAVIAIILSRYIYFATLLIAIDACIDYFDGRLARKRNQVTILGAKLDVVNDFLAFIVAPMVIIFHVLTPSFSLVVVSFAMVYIVAGSYRLYREYCREHSTRFLGLPTTITGLLLLGLLHLSLVFLGNGEVVIVYTVLGVFMLSLFMVSNLQIKRLS